MSGSVFRRLLRRLSPTGRARGTADEPWTLAYEPVATEQDIRACFRLLLGRNPNREEWRGHRMRAGESLPGVVASYLGSLEFSRRGLLRQDHMGETALADLGSFRILTATGDAAVGRHVRENAYEPDVTAVFRRLLAPGMGVVDLGANIGYFTMLSASLVGPDGYVLAVEPNPGNVRLLEASRRLNGFEHVTVCQVAAAPAPGLLALNASHSNGTTSGLPADIEAMLAATLVPCVRPDTLMPPDRRIDLVKADVEGAEYGALLGCSETVARHRPVIVSEFSPSLMPGISGISGRDYLGFLSGLGYVLGVIEPAGSVRPASEDAVMAEYEARGTDHLDILATPTERLPVFRSGPTK